MSQCRGCGAEMKWAIHEHSGRGVPLDPEPFPAGNLVSTGEVREGRVVIRYLGKNETPPPGVPRYRTHFASCPEGSSFRKKR